MNSEARTLSEAEALDSISDLISGAPAPGDEEEPESPAEMPEEGEEGEESEETREEEAVEETQELRSLPDLAEYLGVSIEDIYDLELPMPDGRDPIKLGQWKDRETEIARLQEDLQRQRERYEQAEAQVEAALSAAQYIPQEVQDAQLEVKRLYDQAQSVDWARFEQKEPGRAALAKQKLQEAIGKAQYKLQQVAQNAHQVQQQANAQRVLQEQRILLEAIPEWRNPETAKAEIRQMVDTLSKRYGFSEQELMSLSDHRTVLAIRDYVRLLEKAGDANAAMKRVQNAPKHLRPVKGAVRRTADQKRQAELTKRAKQLGTPDAQAAAVSNLLSSRGIL